MIISILVAMDEKGGIGYKNRIPWRLSTDLARFKRISLNHYILMGRKTFESIGRPLPGRNNIILTHNPTYQPVDTIIAHSLSEGVKIALLNREVELFIIGGANVFQQAMRCVDRIYLTLVHAVVKSDVFFPEHDENDWVVVYQEEIPQGEKDDFPTTYKILDRRFTLT